MAWLSGVVTYSEKKLSKPNEKGERNEFGILAIEGISMFCAPNMLPEVGSEVRVFVQGQSRRQEDGSYQSSINCLAVQPAFNYGNNVSLHPIGNAG